MGSQRSASIEEIVKRYLDAKWTSVQFVAETAGIRRQSLHEKVRKFLEDNPEFEDRYRMEWEAQKKSA